MKGYFNSFFSKTVSKTNCNSHVCDQSCWSNTPLALHILLKLVSVPVEELTPRDLRDCIGPLWHEKADTARKALNRTNLVIRHAAALGLDVDIGLAEKTQLLLG